MSVCFPDIPGQQAANNFRDAKDEAKNRSGYSSGNQSPSSNRPGSSSSSYSSGQSTTDKIKEKAGEFAEQAKSTVSIENTIDRCSSRSLARRPNRRVPPLKVTQVKLPTKRKTVKHCPALSPFHVVCLRSRG